MSGRVPLNDAAAEAATRRRVAAPPPGAVSADAPATDAAGGAPPRRSRANRKPFGSREQRLAYPPREGYHRHWFNDVPGRIIRAQEAGYEQVHGPDGKPVSEVVGTSRGGGSLTAYLMEMPREWYDEDMAAQEEAVLELLGQIRTGAYQRPNGRDGDLRYTGSNRGDISIQMGNRR